MFVLCMETVFSCFLSIKNVHHFSKIFQLLHVLFSCAVSDFLYEEFSAKPIRAKITVILFFYSNGSPNFIRSSSDKDS